MSTESYTTTSDTTLTGKYDPREDFERHEKLTEQRPKRNRQPRATCVPPQRSRFRRGWFFFGSADKRCPAQWRHCADRVLGWRRNASGTSQQNTSILPTSDTTNSARNRAGSTTSTVEEKSSHERGRTLATRPRSRLTAGRQCECSLLQTCFYSNVLSTVYYYCYHSDVTTTHTPRHRATSHVVAPIRRVEDRGGRS